MIDVRNDLKQLLATLTYTDKDGQSQNVHVFLETELDDYAKARWPTPAFIIRGMRTLPMPADIGWNNYAEKAEITVSLYLKQRADTYDAEAVRKELSKAVDDLIKAHKSGIGGTHYAKIVAVDDRDWVESKGTLRRDFTIEVYKEDWGG